MGYGMDEYEGGLNFDDDEIEYRTERSRALRVHAKPRKYENTSKTKCCCKCSKKLTEIKEINNSKKSSRGLKIEMQCHCGEKYMARVADLNRGWARSCSKRCASIRREYGRGEAVIAATGKKYK
ncbi:MAG: hypothetical protein ACRC8W_20620 [Plesiomonas shigelloides]